MKKTILTLIGSVAVILSIKAQDAPIDLYRAGTNELNPIFASNFISTGSVTTGTPYEGSEHFLLDYNVSGWYAGGAWNINDWGGYVQNFSNHTHLVIAHKGSGTAANTLKFSLQDASVTGPSVTIASASATYQIDTIPLSSFVGVTTLNLANVNRLNFTIGAAAAASTGQFYIDNIQIIDLVPEINVKAGATNVALSGSVDFGNSVVIGVTTAPITFTIENTGTSSLTLSGTPKVVLSGTDQADFSIVQSGVSGTISKAGSNTFTITFTPSSAGAKTASITIANNDSDEGTYIINLTGTGIVAPEINLKGNSLGIASGGSFDFGNSLLGTPSSDIIFTIENSGSGTLNLSGLPIVSIGGSNSSDFIITQTSLSNSISPSGNSIFTVSFTPSALGIRSAFITISNDDTDEPSYLINLSGTGIAPEINVLGNSSTIANGGSFDFGNSLQGTATSDITFIIENSGTSDLNLSGIPKINLTGTNSSDFTIVQTTVNSTVLSSGSTLFTISFNPSSVGLRTASISIANDDSDEGTYTINLTGTGTVTGIMSPDVNNDSHAIAYPTLFTNETTLTINSIATTPINLKVCNEQGKIVFSSEDFFTNQEIIMGNEWKQGIYFIYVTSQNKMQMVKIIKL
jgi:hypothetical protein